MAEARAIVFDLDDTLYPSHAFARSGFVAIARKLAAERGLSTLRVVRTLSRSRRTHAGREIQALCKAAGLPLSLVPALVRVLREHTPSIGLPVHSRRVLATLRSSWRIGVLTNGRPSIQRRKVVALGLDGLVDVVVFAREWGDGRGKPDAAPFRAVLRQLRTSPGSSVFVGDNVVADMQGASAVGMRTIHLLTTGTACARSCCGVHARHLDRIPRLAARLLSRRHGHAL
jgi:putative hydrolase of the HAD superfamily